MADYYRGTVVRCAVTFTDSDGGFVDPTTVVFKVRRPRVSARVPVSVATYPTTRDSVGKFHVDLTTDVVGQWLYRFEGSGNLTAGVEGTFTVKAATI